MKETKTLVPFEDHFYPKAIEDQLVMIQVMNAENYNGDIVKCHKNDFDNWLCIKEEDLNGKLVSVLSNPVTGEEYCAIGTSTFGAVADICYNKELIPRDYSYYSSGRLSYGEVMYKFDGSIRYRAKMEVIDNMLVVRNYRFSNFKENYGQGWFECSRFIFDGTQIAYETRERFDAKFNMRSYKYVTDRMATKKQNAGKTEKEQIRIGYNTVMTASIFNEYKSTSKTAVLETYPWMADSTKHNTSISTTLLVELLSCIPKTTKIYKIVPENIKNDLSIVHLKNNKQENNEEEISYSTMSQIINPQHVLKFHLYQEPDLSCYYCEVVDDNCKIIVGKRIYFTKDEIFCFNWNPIEKAYASIPTAHFGREPFADSTFVVPTSKNGTEIDRIVGICEYIKEYYDTDEYEEVPFGGIQRIKAYKSVKRTRKSIKGGELIYLLAIPAAEKVAKIGFQIRTEVPYYNNKRYGHRIKRTISENKHLFYEYWKMPTNVIKEFESAKTVADLFNTTNEGIELMFKLDSRQSIELLEFMATMRLPNMQCVSKEFRTAVAYHFKYNPMDEVPEAELKYYERMAKACKKNNTLSEFKDKAHLFDDYNKLRKEFALITPRLIEAGVDIGEYQFPEFPKPSHLHHLHDAVTREVNRYKDLVDAEKAKETSRQITEFSETKEYTQFLNSENEETYKFLPATSGEDLVREGAFLHHCVGTYRERMAKQVSYIYFLRKAKEVDTPFYTLEVKKTTGGKYYLNQCYTFHDSTVKTEDCRKFIEQWANGHSIEIQCMV